MEHWQTKDINQIKEHLIKYKDRLDFIMYDFENPLNDKDYEYCRQIYDNICKTIDVI